MTRPVFLADGLDSDPAVAEIGDLLELGGGEGRHAAQVRRIGAGESLDVVDGDGLRLTCEVEASSARGLTLRVIDRVVEPEPVPRLVLVQALAKGGRDERAVEMCTEIGVDEVVPWQSARTIVRWAGPRAAKGCAKWEGVVRAAAKQARRARVPVVHGVVDSAGLVEWVSSVIDGGGVVLVCHEEATVPLTRVLAESAIEALGAGSRVAIIVGPEGGIDPDESRALSEAGAELIGLGANVLRASTAGAVAATLIASATGRL